MGSNREWMYSRFKEGLLTEEFLTGLDEFIAFARRHPECMDVNKMRCPCNRRKCQNRSFEEVDVVKYHLAKYGFVSGYYRWTRHGEIDEGVNRDQNVNDLYQQSTFEFEGESSNAYNTMVMDVAGPEFNPEDMEESPNPEAQKFYDMLSAANKEIWPGCANHSQLSAVARLLNIKSEHRLSDRCYDDICQLMKELLPDNNVMTDNFYSTKKLVQGMGLPVEKIHCCSNGCMIYWGEDGELNCCKFCEHPRYKRPSRGCDAPKKDVPYKKMYYFPITSRLQRLYASNATAKHMRWHAEHEVEEGVMRHPSESIAWKHFNQTHPPFAAECRNVRLGLCTDGFQPFGQSGQQYSSWPVIITPYNLPPWMCMKDEYLFLSVIVPGPRNPKGGLDVFLQPLIAELKQLWDVGVETYDIYSKQNFFMRAALMWTISDFPAYSMLSGWGTAGKMACPYCMEMSDAFTLPHGGKTSWFDTHRKFLPANHPFRRNKTSFIKNRVVTGGPPKIRTGAELLQQIEQLGLKKVTEYDAQQRNGLISKKSGWKKRSIFWDLPYWSTNLIRHNLDVMHIEKNVFDNVFNTVMNVQGKTKDNAKSREDLKEFCRRPELERHPTTGKYPKACYTLDKPAKGALCEWLKTLKFPDGYVSNMGRCVDMNKHKLNGMKSHDCHVFMQRLIPIAFRELLPAHVWQALTELSLMFKELTTTVIREEDMMRLQSEVPIILCKLARIFPPSFFDSMEHLPIHLPYEALIAGPVQYRWMYPFERYLRRLKNNVKNKARVEGSICNAYLVEEASLFCSHYFEPHVNTRHRTVPRNNDDGGDETDEIEGMLSIFKHPGRSFGQKKSRFLTEEEYRAAQMYVLLNCSEVAPYINIYAAELRENEPNITDREVDAKLEHEFASWFNTYVHDPTKNISNQFLKDLAKGPLRTVKSYPGYFINGYKFHTEGYGSNRTTMNSGVCIKGSNYSTDESDYYGKLIEVLQLEYHALPIKRTVLFKCEWFDPTPNIGIKVHKQYNLIEVNHRRKFNRYEPFVLAMQSTQVYYTTYPSLRRNKSDWWAVCKVKPRSIIEMPEPRVAPFQEDANDVHSIEIRADGEVGLLNDPNGSFIDDIDDVEVESEDEIEVESMSENEDEDEELD